MELFVILRSYISEEWITIDVPPDVTCQETYDLNLLFKLFELVLQVLIFFKI